MWANNVFDQTLWIIMIDYSFWWAKSIQYQITLTIKALVLVVIYQVWRLQNKLLWGSTH